MGCGGETETIRLAGVATISEILPSHQGSYVLHLQLPSPATLTIGKLGRFDFPAGWYAYVGSAFGTGGLQGRLKHHLAPVQHPHWHIDYFRQTASVEQIWFVQSSVPYEHEWATTLQKLSGDAILISRFGASDCRCATHLFYFDSPPLVSSFCDLHEDAALSYGNTCTDSPLQVTVLQVVY